MVTPSSIYWLTRLDVVNTLGIILTVFGGIFSIATWVTICVVGCLEDTVEEKALTLKLAKWTTAIATVGIFIACFVPTTKEMAAIIVVPRIANSESVQQLGEGIVTLAQDWLKELSPKKGEAK